MSEINGQATTVERLEENKVKLTFSISPEKFEEGLRYAYNENKGKINIPGFRKGKVPRKLIESQFGKEFFYEDAINHLLPEAYGEAVEESGLDVVSKPVIDVLEANADTGAVITAEVYLKPKAEVTDYMGLGYKPADTSVTDSEVERELDMEREKNARFIPVTDRPLQNGDISTIDFEGFVDGVAFDGGKGEDYELTIGSGQFIPGFEEQMVGMSTGETRSINVSFPENYQAEHLAGAPAVFEVTLKAFHIKEVPGADDDFAQNVSEFDTLEEYKNEIKAKITERKEHEAVHSKENAVVAALAERATVNIPDAMVDSETENMVNNFARQLSSRGMRLKDYLAYTEGSVEDLKASYKDNAYRNIKSRLALEAVAEAEGIEVTDEEADDELNQMAQTYGMELDKLKAAMSPGEVRALKLDVRVQKALKLIVDNAVAAESDAVVDELSE